MKKITIYNTGYVVYGNNEKKDNLKPHIEVAETGIVPEGKQRGLLLLYLEEKGIEPIQGATTYWLSLIHISEPTRPVVTSRMPSSA